MKKSKDYQTPEDYPVCTDAPHHWMIEKVYTIEDCPFCPPMENRTTLCFHVGASLQICKKCNQPWIAAGFNDAVSVWSRSKLHEQQTVDRKTLARRQASETA